MSTSLDCGDNMLALGVSHAVRDDLDFAARPRRLDDLAQRDGGAGGRVELGGVVGFGDGEVVAVQLGQRSAVRRKSFCTPMEKLVP